MPTIQTDPIDFFKIANTSRIISIDYGTKKTGLAMAIKPDFVSFEIGVCNTSEILENITKHSPTAVAIGFPFAYSKTSPICIPILNLASKIISELSLDIILIEEGGTSVNAKNQLKSIHGRLNKRSLKKYDSLAAKIILENLLVNK